MTELRDQARAALHVYMSRTQLSLPEIGELAGFSPHTMRQFSSGARFGNRDGLGDTTARRLMEFFREYPAPLPEIDGTLYPTDATRSMDRLLDWARRAGWGILYGPAGAQKSYLLRRRAAESAREPEAAVALVDADPCLRPRALLGRIAQAVGAPYGQYAEGLRHNILLALRRRQRPLALVVDEAQLLHGEIDTLETLRRLGDQAGRRLGLVLAGNEDVLRLFETRRGMYFEQWRSRVEQRTVRVLGPSPAEARGMIAGELGRDPGDRVAENMIGRCTVADPETKRAYVNVRRLFNSLREVQDARRVQ